MKGPVSNVVSMAHQVTCQASDMLAWMCTQAKMVYNAPLHRTEQWLRSLTKRHWVTTHWILLWLILVAIRMEYLAAVHDNGFRANLAATAIFYGLWAAFEVSKGWREATCTCLHSSHPITS